MAADPVVVLVGTLDTKGHELEYMATACGRPAPRSCSDPDAQRRYLGVEPIATEE
jgi:hypothetical protein